MRRRPWIGLLTGAMLYEFIGPLIVFYGARALGVDQLVALLLGSALSLAGAVQQIRVERRLSGVTIFVLATMLLTVGMSFVAGSPRVLLVRDAWGTAALGLWLLITLFFRRPFLYEGTRLVSDREQREAWAASWASSAPLRRLLRAGTAICGCAFLVDAALRVLMAIYLPIDVVPLLDDVLLVVTLLALVVALRKGGRAYLRGRGLRLDGPELVPHPPA
ncbi:VC0807 family protein [Saccharopolyspora sp. NPDC002578]